MSRFSYIPTSCQTTTLLLILAISVLSYYMLVCTICNIRPVRVVVRYTITPRSTRRQRFVLGKNKGHLPHAGEDVLGIFHRGWWNATICSPSSCSNWDSEIRPLSAFHYSSDLTILSFVRTLHPDTVICSRWQSSTEVSQHCYTRKFPWRNLS